MLSTRQRTGKPLLLSGRKIFGKSSSNTLFRSRGKEITRIETFTDAVFAFSVSLLIVSLEVPQTFKELRQILQSFLPFAATVALVFLFWYQQYRFFRNYGLNDSKIILLNALLLILVLFYVYPLKFLFSLLFSMVLPFDFFPKATAAKEAVMSQQELPQLIMIYSAGYAAIWLVFFLMYNRAWKERAVLKLDHFETEDTLKEIRGAFMNCMVGVAGLVAALFGSPQVAGFIFLLIPLILIANHWYFTWRLKRGSL